MGLSTDKDNLKRRHRLSWYEMRIFLYQFVLTFFPVILLSAFATYIYVSKSYEKLELSTEAAVSQLQGNLDELLVQLQGYYVGTAEATMVKWFVDEKVGYSDYSKLIAVSEVLNGNSVFFDYVNGFTIINFRTQWVFSSRGMYPYEQLVNKEEVEELYRVNKENFNPYYWVFNPKRHDVLVRPREYADHDGLCLVVRLPAIGINSNAMVIAKIDYNALIAKVTNNLSKYDGVILTDEGAVIYASDAELAERLLAGAEDIVKLSNGKTCHVVEKKSNVLGMTYYIAGDTSAAWGDVDSIWGGTIVVLALAAVMFVAVIWSSRKLYQPVAALTKQVGSLAGELKSDSPEVVADVAAGDERQNNIHRRNELENIARQVNILVSDKEQAVETSLARKEKLLAMTASALIKGELSKEELDRSIEQLGFKIKPYYMAAAGIIRNRNTCDPIENSAMKELVNELPPDIKELFYLPPVLHSDVLVFTAASDGEVKLNMKLERLYNAVNARLASEGLCLELVMGVSSVNDDLLKLRGAYKEARKAIGTRLKAGERLVFYSGEDEDKKSFYNYDTLLEKRIKEAVEKCDMDTASECMDEFVDDMFRNGAGNDNYVYVYRMIMTVLMVPSEFGVQAGQDMKDSDIFSRAGQIFDSDRLKKYLREDVLEPVILAIDEAQGKRSTEIMEKIKAVVHEREGDITLTECAQELDYHPNYLWKIIKSQLGITFTEYIAQYRLERAKELLTQTDMSVAAIAEQLKYTNAQNFIRFFNKMTDMTPGKYRQEFKNR